MRRDPFSSSSRVLRRRSSWLLPALAGVAIVLAAAVWLGMRSDREPSGPVAVTVPQLWAHPDTYRGRRVATRGTLRIFDAGKPSEYDVLEVAGQYRVGLRGVPPAHLRPCAGQEVRVVGVAEFETGFGAAIVIADPTPAAGTGGCPLTPGAASL